MGMLTCVTEELSEKCVIIMTVIGYKYIDSLKYHCYDLGSMELNMDGLLVQHINDETKL